jgi:transposase-like protein
VSTAGIPRPHTRKVERPSYEQLLREIEESSYVAVGRRYGVSDNAIRKWILFHKREQERLEREAAQSGEREAA